MLSVPPSKAKQLSNSRPAESDANEVARRAGVSAVTVSRALNNSPLVSGATRERVLAAAREVGYRPNPVARALRQQRTNSVAIVIKAPLLSGPFYSEMMGGFHNVIHERELSVLLTVAPEDLPRFYLDQLVRASAFDGIVLHADVVRQVGTEAVRSLQMPVVVAGLLNAQSKKDRELICVGYDHRGAVQQSVRYLVSLGHKRIAWLDTPHIKRPSTREDTFRKEMAAAGLRVVENWIASGRLDDDPAVGTEFIHAVLSARTPHPTAVICATDLLAAGVMEGARNWGRNVPTDLSVVGYGDGPWAPVVKPALTTLHQRGWDLGVALGTKLLACCDGTCEDESWAILPMPLTVRDSTAPAAK